MINKRAQAMGAKLGPNTTRRVFFDAGNRLMDNSLLRHPDVRVHAAEYLGKLFTFVDRRESDIVERQAISEIAGTPAPKAEVSISMAFYVTAGEVVGEYGDPQLSGTDEPADPGQHGMEMAQCANDAVRIVQEEVVQAIDRAHLGVKS